MARGVYHDPDAGNYSTAQLSLARWQNSRKSLPVVEDMLRNTLDFPVICGACAKRRPDDEVQTLRYPR